MTDYAPELLLGDPWGDYKAITCFLVGTSAAVAKGDFVTLVSATVEPAEVSASAKDEYAFGIVMKAGAAGTYISVGILGQFKVTAGTGGCTAGASVLPYAQASVYGVTTKTGFARAMQTLAVGDTGLIYITGGVA